MHYAVAFFPSTGTGEIEAFRAKYDPTAALLGAHLTLVFPVPETIGGGTLSAHCERVLDRREPFPIRPSGFSKSPDHWLFLDVDSEEGAIRALYRELSSGPLTAHARPDLFSPHIGLGHFLKPGALYDWNDPTPDLLDEERYESARREAEELALPSAWRLDRLELVELSDEVLDWATGRVRSLSSTARAERRHTFMLS